MKRTPIDQAYPNLSKKGVVTVPFGGRTIYESFHPGVDIAAEKGTPIKAPVDGVVVNTTEGKRQGDQGYGNLVKIRTNSGEQHQLGHLDRVNLKPGDNVKAGQTRVGTLGNSGSSYSLSGKGDGSHLDYRISDAYRRYKNPSLYVRNL